MNQVKSQGQLLGTDQGLWKLATSLKLSRDSAHNYSPAFISTSDSRCTILWQQAPYVAFYLDIEASISKRKNAQETKSLFQACSATLYTEWKLLMRAYC